MKNSNVAFTAKAALIAALYVVLTLISAMFGLSSNVIQVRISEALSFLPYLNSAAIPGLTIGCLISNALAGGVPLDIIFGSTATLLGAILAHLIGRLTKNSTHKVFFMVLSTLPNVITNVLIIPWVLKIAYGAEDAVPFMMMTVGIGEFIASTIIGTVVILAIKNNQKLLK